MSLEIFLYLFQTVDRAILKFWYLFTKLVFAIEYTTIEMTLKVVRHQCTVHGLALKVTCLNNERTRGHFVTFARFARSVTFWVPTHNCKQYSNLPQTFLF